MRSADRSVTKTYQKDEGLQSAPKQSNDRPDRRTRVPPSTKQRLWTPSPMDPRDARPGSASGGHAFDDRVGIGQPVRQPHPLDGRPAQHVGQDLVGKARHDPARSPAATTVRPPSTRSSAKPDIPTSNDPAQVGFVASPIARSFGRIERRPWNTPGSITPHDIVEDLQCTSMMTFGSGEDWSYLAKFGIRLRSFCRWRHLTGRSWP
jgi:hypothetical protein